MNMAVAKFLTGSKCKMTNQNLKIDEEFKKEIDSYLKSSFLKRMDLIKKYLEDGEKLNIFLNLLEENIYLKLQNSNSQKEDVYKFLEKISETRRLLEIKSAYKKMIFEYLSLTAPSIND
jgi:predicted DNA-binding antitoxin AbrB/MazE fold protein